MDSSLEIRLRNDNSTKRSEATKYSEIYRYVEGGGLELAASPTAPLTVVVLKYPAMQIFASQRETWPRRYRSNIDL